MKCKECGCELISGRDMGEGGKGGYCNNEGQICLACYKQGEFLNRWFRSLEGINRSIQVINGFKAGVAS
jgi:hypothetical protein